MAYNCGRTYNVCRPWRKLADGRYERRVVGYIGESGQLVSQKSLRVVSAEGYRKMMATPTEYLIPVETKKDGAK